MTRLEPGSHQLLPNVRQLLQLRTEQVDALAAGDFGVQTVLFRHFSENDQFFGRDLAGRHARHYRVQAPALQIGQKAIVGVLNGRVIENVFVPQARQDRCDDGLAHFAAVALPVSLHHSIEAAVAFDFHHVEQLLAREGEVLADLPPRLLSPAGQFCRQKVAQYWNAAPAAGSGACRGLDLFYSREILTAHRGANCPASDVVTRAHKRVLGKKTARGPTTLLLRLRSLHQYTRGGWRRCSGMHQGDQLGIVASVAHQNAAEQALATPSEEKFAVHPGEGVGVHRCIHTVARSVEVAETRDLHPQKLQLG